MPSINKTVEYQNYVNQGKSEDTPYSAITIEAFTCWICVSKDMQTVRKLQHSLIHSKERKEKEILAMALLL